MNATKVIDHIEPFNDVFYKNCFYNSAFPMARCFKKSVLPFLINDVITYTYDPAGSGMKLNTDYLSCLTMPELLKTAGINVATKETGDNIIHDIQKSIAGERPVIIWVDCFYESIRKDMYQKKHWAHTWLVYGYDDQNQVCNIIEHRHKDNLTYEKRVISYADLENSYAGYLNHFRLSPEEAAYYEFSAAPELSGPTIGPTEYRAAFLANLLQKWDHVHQSIQYLDLFQTEYSRIIASQELLNSTLDDIIAGINDIINSKQVERYKIEQLFGRDFEGYPLLLEIIERWTSIRAVHVKYLYSEVYKPDIFQDSLSSLKQIPNLEYRYLDSIAAGGTGVRESATEVVVHEPETIVNTGLEYVAPTCEMEKRLADIWREILEVDRIGIHDNFFDLGGNSIKVIPIIEKAKQFGFELSINDIFSGKTIANICANIDQSPPTNSAAETTREQSDPAPQNRNPLFYSLKESRQYEVDDQEVKILRIKLHNEITIFLHYALPLAVIFVDERLLPWYYEHFIDIYAVSNENGLLNLDFLEYSVPYNRCTTALSFGYNVLQEVSNIIEFVIDKINQGYYVIIHTDEFYLPEKSYYQKEHFIHPSLIYGYHNPDQKLLAIGFNQDHLFTKITFDYDQFIEAFEKGKIYYKQTAPWTENNAVELLKLNDHQQEFPFSLKKFVFKLDNYLSSAGDDAIIFNFMLNKEKVKYGVDVYDEVIHHLENALKGQLTLDYRAIHFLAEHKKGIYNRLQYITNRYKLTGDIVTLTKRYSLIVEQLESIRIKFLEFRYVIDSIENLRNAVKNAIPIFKSIQENEQMLLGDISKQLAYIVTEMN